MLHLFNKNLFQNNFVRNINQISYSKLYNACVCSPCGTCVSLVYQTWEHCSWMSWWTVCCHAWVHRRRPFHWVDRQPGGPHIFLHTPFSTISMVRMCIFVINWPLILCLVPLGVLAAGAHVMVPVTSRFLLVTQHTWLLTSLTLLEDYQNLRTPSSSFMNNYNILWVSSWDSSY